MANKSPIKSGWRGHLNGFVEATEGAHVQVSEITLKLDMRTAWVLCNQLHDDALDAHVAIQHREMLSNLGAAIGRLIDHPSANNGGRSVVKP